MIIAGIWVAFFQECQQYDRANRLHFPGDAGFAAATAMKQPNTNFLGIRQGGVGNPNRTSALPAAVVSADSAADVAKSVTFAATHRIRVAVKTTGTPP